MKQKIEYSKIWSEILKQGSGVISLHRNEEYIELVKSFDCKSFIIDSAKFLSRSSFDELNLCFPFLWENLTKEDVVDILKKLDGEKVEATLSVFYFIGRFIGVNVISEYLKLDVKNAKLLDFVEGNYELISSKMKIGAVQSDMISESRLPIEDFYRIRESWIHKGFTLWS